MCFLDCLPRLCLDWSVSIRGGAALSLTVLSFKICHKEQNHFRGSSSKRGTNGVLKISALLAISQPEWKIPPSSSTTPPTSNGSDYKQLLLKKKAGHGRNQRRSTSATTIYSETKVSHIPHSWKNQPIYVILMLYRVVGYQQVQEVSCNVRWCIFLNGKLLIRSWENWRKRWRKRVSLFQGWPHKISFPRRNQCPSPLRPVCSSRSEGLAIT